MADGRPVEILIVEDSPGDARLVEEGLRQGRLANRLHHVLDGNQATAFLHRRGDYAEAPRPDLVLLDLNLPGKDGREVLAEMKADPDLRKIPVIALTTSSAEEDVEACYRAGANAYITKPVDLDKFMEAIQSLDRFWFSVVTLPNGWEG